MFRDLHLVDQILSVVVYGATVLVLLSVAVFLLPELWRAGRDTITALLRPEPDVPHSAALPEGDRHARLADGGDAANQSTPRVPDVRARMAAAAHLGSDSARVRGLSDRVAGVGLVSLERRSAAKGVNRRP
jgi:hypothetical protein